MSRGDLVAISLVAECHSEGHKLCTDPEKISEVFRIKCNVSRHWSKCFYLPIKSKWSALTISASKTDGWQTISYEAKCWHFQTKRLFSTLQHDAVTTNGRRVKDYFSGGCRLRCDSVHSTHENTAGENRAVACDSGPSRCSFRFECFCIFSWLTVKFFCFALRYSFSEICNNFTPLTLF